MGVAWHVPSHNAVNTLSNYPVFKFFLYTLLSEVRRTFSETSRQDASLEPNLFFHQSVTLMRKKYEALQSGPPLNQEMPKIEIKNFPRVKT